MSNWKNWSPLPDPDWHEEQERRYRQAVEDSEYYGQKEIDPKENPEAFERQQEERWDEEGQGR